MFKLETKLEVALAVILIAGGLFAWHSSSDQAAQRAATDTEIKLREEQMDEFKRTISVQQSALESQQKAVASQRAQVPKLGPGELASLVASQINGSQIQPDNSIVVPPSAQAAAATAKYDCDKCALDLKSREYEVELKTEQLQQVTAERDALKKELKGGTFWHRFGKTAKDIGIGIAVAEAIHLATGH